MPKTKTTKTTKIKRSTNGPALKKFTSSFITWAPGLQNHFVHQGSPSWALHAYSIHAQAQARVKERLEITPNVKHGAKETDKFRSNLRKTTDDFAAFFIEEVAPLELALSAAVDEVKEHLALATGTKVAKFDVRRIKKAADLLVNMRFVDFMCKKFKVSKDIRERALESINEPTKQVVPDLLSLLRVQKAGEGTDGLLHRIQELQEGQRQSRFDPQRPRYPAGAASSGYRR